MKFPPSKLWPPLPSSLPMPTPVLCRDGLLRYRLPPVDLEEAMQQESERVWRDKLSR